MDAIKKIEDGKKFDAELWAELYTLREAVKGPEGYTSWQDAAVDERMKRHAAEQTLASKDAEIERLKAALTALVDRDFTFFSGQMIGASKAITRDEILTAREVLTTTPQPTE